MKEWQNPMMVNLGLEDTKSCKNPLHLSTKDRRSSSSDSSKDGDSDCSNDCPNNGLDS